MTFNIPPFKPKYPLPPEIARLFLPKIVMRPSEWAIDHFILGKGYGEQGLITFEGREWQIDIVDAFYEGYKTVIVCGPVQSGKSIAGMDVPWTWWNANVGGHSLLVYEGKNKVKDVFEERLKPSVKENLKELWSGNEDDLTIEKLSLLNGIARCASANIENDIATFSSDLVLLDEVAKYTYDSPGAFDVVGAARGRQKSYKGMPGYHALMGIVSSPKKKGDPLYREVYRGGILILRYRMPCPRCSHYHELMDDNIKEIPNAAGELDHNPVRIRLDGAAKYECPHCHQDILNQDRWKMCAAGVWAADGEDVSLDGRIINPVTLRGKTDSVCFQFNRLITMPDMYSWSDCLSAFFGARQANDPRAWYIYQNEDMARFIDPKTLQISESMLVAKCLHYFQYGDAARIPDEVAILIAGVDTQDDGFYFVVRGFGKNMESWLIRHAFISCDIHNELYRDPNEVLKCFKTGIMSPAYMRGDDTEMGIVFGLIDEGGHRQADVHYICRNIPAFKPYKGSTSPTAEPLRRSRTGPQWNGNTRHWSELVGNHMEADGWHLPKDVGKDYLEQVVKQYNTEETDARGNKKYVWISGGKDHYRSCENYLLAAANVLNLPEKLNDPAALDKVRAAVLAKTKQQVTQAVPAQQQQAQKPDAMKPLDPFTNRRDPFTSKNPFSRRYR